MTKTSENSYFSGEHAVHALGNTPFSMKSLQIRQVSSTTSASLSRMMRSAERLISLSSSSLSMAVFPRFLERYWQTAAGVIPNFSAASFWFNPKSDIMLSAISFRMTGSPFHKIYSQGVRFIERYNRIFVLIISVLFERKMLFSDYEKKVVYGVTRKGKI